MMPGSMAATRYRGAPPPRSTPRDLYVAGADKVDYDEPRSREACIPHTQPVTGRKIYGGGRTGVRVLCVHADAQ